MMKTDAKIIDADVLVVGGGSAGLWAALALTEKAPDKKVVIVDKGPADWGGLMRMAGGDFEAVLPPDDVDQWLEDLVYYFDGLCDQHLMQKVLAQSAARMKDMRPLAANFSASRMALSKVCLNVGCPTSSSFLPDKKDEAASSWSKALWHA